MRRNLLVALTALVVALSFGSCKSGDKSGLPIPKTAGLVLHINTPSLASKLTWEDIKNAGWFKEIYADATDTVARELLNDPGASGINTDADLVFFTSPRGKGGYAAFEGTLKDAAAFEAFNKKAEPAGTTKKEGDITVFKGKENTIATWNGTQFIYIVDMPGMNMNSRYSGMSGYEPFPYDSLVAFAKELYTLKSSNSLADDKKYAALTKEAGDIHMWFNAETMLGNSLSDMMSMMKASVLFEGNITAASINFDNGKIVMSTKSYYNDELKKIYEKYPMKNVDPSAFSRVPAQNVVAAFSFNYPPDGLKDFMKVIGVDGFVNSFMGDLGYSVDEFVKANKGDVLFTVSDLEVKTQTITMPGDEEGTPGPSYTSTKPEFKAMFATSINDKPSFDKLIASIKSKFGEEAERNPLGVTYALNDKWFAAGNSQEQVDGFLAGSSNKQHAFISKISGHPAGFYVDLQKVLQEFHKADTDTISPTRQVLAESLKMWEDIIVTGGEIKDGAREGTAVVNLVDKSANSLKQLNQYMDRVNTLSPKRRGF